MHVGANANDLLILVKGDDCIVAKVLHNIMIWVLYTTTTILMYNYGHTLKLNL